MAGRDEADGSAADAILIAATGLAILTGSRPVGRARMRSGAATEEPRRSPPPAAPAPCGVSATLPFGPAPLPRASMPRPHRSASLVARHPPASDPAAAPPGRPVTVARDSFAVGTVADVRTVAAATTDTLRSTPLPAAVPVATAAAEAAAPVIAASVTVSLIAEAAVPQPAAAGQVVGLVLQNPTAGALAARYVTFGMQFADGQVPPGRTLFALTGGNSEAVQMDVKTTYADGSVATAVLTLQQPALAAGAALPVMLSLGGTATGTPALPIEVLTDQAAYGVTVSLTGITQNGYASTTSAVPSTSTPIPDVTIDVGQLLAQALAGSGGASLSYWLEGPLATQVRIDSGQIAGTPLHLTFDITLYADGSIATDIQFNNDIAMQAALGSETTALQYNVAITQTVAGTTSTVLQQSGVSQWQYQTWDATVWSDGAPGVNVQRDAAAMEQAGVVPAYDLTAGVDASLLAAEADTLGGSAFGILGPGGIAPDMSQPGGSLQPDWVALWLATQNATAAQYVLAQAASGGSVPWHFRDPATGGMLTVTADPILWAAQGAGGNGTQALPQPAAGPAQDGWTPGTAGMPDLAYVAYLMTGDRYYLDQLNAEAAYGALATAPPARGFGTGIVAAGPLSAQAWALRGIVEAAAANPDGSAEKAYFTQLATANIAYLLAEATSAGEGQVAGWFAGNGTTSGNGLLMAPWQEEDLALTLAEAAGLGIQGAKPLLAWMGNFLAGLFLSGAAGLSPTDGADASLALATASGTPFTTWAQAATASAAAGALGSGTLSADPTSLELARAALAACITWTGSTRAIAAYAWLCADAPALTTTLAQDDPALDIVPRLSDGSLLSNAQVFIRSDDGAAPVLVQEGAADQLVYETGSAPVTIVGGGGINLLFGGAGATTLVGGPGNDDLFAGTGPTTFESGSGNDVLQAGTGGSGADLIVLSGADIGTDVIAGLRIGTDHLQVAGGPPGSPALVSLIAATTQDAAGEAVLHLSADHAVVLQGIAAAQVTDALFA